ncbi:MAG: Ig-like domain-containing protein, partial [Syntrophales bacterium]
LAAVRTASVSGNWSSTTTWGSAVPTSADAVTINSGITVIVDVALAEAASITFGTSVTAATGITINGTNSLTVSGAITMGAPGTSGTNTLAVGTGTLSASSISITGAASPKSSAVTVSTGTINVTGNITFGGTATQAKFTFTDAGRLNIGGSFDAGGAGGALTGGTGTINFNGGAAQTIGAYTTYNNIEINNTFGGVTLLGTTTIGGTLSVTTGTFTVAKGLTVTGATTVTGTLAISDITGSHTFTGDITINSSGIWNQSVNEPVSFSGSLQNDGAFTASLTTNEYTFSGTDKTFSGVNPISIPKVIISGAGSSYTNTGTLTVATALTIIGVTVTLTNNGIINATTTLAGTGTLTNSAIGTLNIGGLCPLDNLANAGTINHSGTDAITTALAKFTNTGTINISGSGTITGITNNAGGIVNHSGSSTITSFNNATSTSTLNISATTVPTITTLTAIVDGNTVNYNGADQTIKATTYNNLTTSGSGTKTAGGVITINGNLSVGPGTILSTANSVNAGGDWVVDGTFSQTAGTTTFTGGGTHTCSGAGNSQFNILVTSSQTINAGSCDLRISNNWTHGTAGIFNEQTSSVTFNGIGVQTQPTVTFVPQLYNMTINNGTSGTMSSRVWTVTNNFVLTSGTFAPSSTSSFKNVTLSGGTLTAPTGNINISGNWTNPGGTFAPGTGTVVLNGTNQTISGSTTFYNLTKSVSTADTLTFTAGTTQTINNTLTLNGASGNLLSLRSSSTGNQWNINPQATRTISYLDVKDSNNINATLIATNGLNITNSGNNTNWNFPVEITVFDHIADVVAGVAGSATYINAAEVIAALPITATANASAVTVPVITWLDTDIYNPALAGNYTFTATLGTIPAGFANTGNFTATVQVVLTATPVQPVTVSFVDSISDISVANGTALETAGLPTIVDVILSDATTSSLEVAWDDGLPVYDGNTANTYLFTGTLTLSEGITNPDNLTASVNVIVAEALAPGQYTLTTSAGTGGTISPATGPYDEGSVVTITAIPDDESYHFDSWSGDLIGSDNPVEITMDSDKSVTANFAQDQAIILDSITITTPANKLSYTVGDILDIGGLVVTGTYSSGPTQIETINNTNISGFNSSVAVTGQVLTITVDGKTTTYTINILTATQTAPVTGEDGNGNATLNNTTPEVVITNQTQPVDITISSGTTDATIDVSSFVSTTEVEGVTIKTGNIPQITITST